MEVGEARFVALAVALRSVLEVLDSPARASGIVRRSVGEQLMAASIEADDEALSVALDRLALILAGDSPDDSR